jgi:hypothetical protein
MSGDCFCEGDTPCACGDGPPQGCRDKVAGCAVRVASIVSGGLCRDGGCRRELQVLGGDHLVADDEEPAPPAYGMLSDDVGGGDSTNSINRAVIDAALGELASMALEDGYGDCCNAEFDGSDQYIQLYEEGAEAPREVRISDPEQAPEALRRLAELLDSLAYRLIQSDVEGLRCEEPR